MRIIFCPSHIAALTELDYVIFIMSDAQQIIVRDLDHSEGVRKLI